MYLLCQFLLLARCEEGAYPNGSVIQGVNEDRRKKWRNPSRGMSFLERSCTSLRMLFAPSLCQKSIAANVWQFRGHTTSIGRMDLPEGASEIISVRADGRAFNHLRPIRFQNNIAPYATGSTLIEWGNTRVICGVSVEESVPRWMKEQNVTGGWITAEYSMLPYSTLTRKQRDISKGKIDGRSQEIQRLIGRSMRSALDLNKLGQRTIWVDCDVLQADGGTRTAAITGAAVALHLAVRKLIEEGKLSENPILGGVAAVSVGIVSGQPMLDLCYTEDVAASVDLNVVMNDKNEFIELQGTGEESTFSPEQLSAMLELGRVGIQQLLQLQQQAIAS